MSAEQTPIFVSKRKLHYMLQVVLEEMFRLYENRRDGGASKFQVDNLESSLKYARSAIAEAIRLEGVKTRVLINIWFLLASIALAVGLRCT